MRKTFYKFLEVFLIFSLLFLKTSSDWFG